MENQFNNPESQDLDQNSGQTHAHVASEGFWRIVWFRRWIVVLMLLLAGSAGWAYFNLVKPKFTSTARLHVTPTGWRGLADAAEEAKSKNFLQTQCEMIRSTPVIAAALARPAVQSLSWPKDQPRPVLHVRKALSASPGKKDDIITLSLLWPEPRESCLLLANLVDAYIARQWSAEGTTAAMSLTVLQAEKDKHLAELTKKAQALAEFRKANGLFCLEDGKSNTVLRRLGELSEARTGSELETILAKVEYESAKAMYDDPAQLARLADRTGGGAREGARLGATIQELEMQLVVARKDLTDEHPAVQALKAQIQQARLLQTQADQQCATGFVGAARQKLAMAQQKEVQIKAAVAEQLKLAEQTNAATAQAAMLEQDVRQAQRMGELLETRIKELTVAGQVPPVAVRVLEEARVDDLAMSPNLARTMAMALGLGLFAGISLALLRHRTDDRIHCSREIPRRLRVPLLGAIPSIRGGRGGYCREQTVVLQSTSPSAEAFRDLRTALYYRGARRNGGSLLVSSALPGEGKTTVASNLAIVMAQTSQRTLLIDADLRRPSLHRIFGVNDDAGVVAVVRDGMPLAEAAQPTAIENLEVLPAGPAVADAAEQLSSAAFAELLRQAAQSYDRVVIDSPPLTSVTDARIISALCDATVLVVRAERSKCRAADEAIEQLLGVGGKLLGAIVNDVPRDSARYGHYGRYGDYRRKRRNKQAKPRAGVPQAVQAAQAAPAGCASSYKDKDSARGAAA